MYFQIVQITKLNDLNHNYITINMITDIEKEKLNNYFNNNITNIDEKEKKLIHEYKNSLNEHELIAMVVGIDILKSSFDIKKSQGYLKWKEKNNK